MRSNEKGLTCVARPAAASDSGFTVTIKNNAKFLPHFAIGSGTQSTLVLVNPSVSQDVSGTVRFFAPNGDPLSLAINGQVQDGSYGFHLPGGTIPAHFLTKRCDPRHTGLPRLAIQSPSNPPAAVESW